MAEQYKYSRIPGATHFRLLELRPGHRDGPIDITITITNFSDTPQYEALSYEWGEIEKVESIKCAGKNIAVTHRLLVALRQLRDNYQSRRLWVDAICINQEDASEKNQQVPLMRDIFSRATQVLIWLGSKGPRTSDAFQMLSKLARFWMVRDVENKRKGELRPLSWENISGEEARLLELRDKSLWDAVYEIMERTYFGRIWIIQEIVVATASRVLCGDLEISWLWFSWGAAYLSRSVYHLHQSPTDKGLACVTMIAALQLRYQKNEPIFLNDLCVSSQGSKATDERDKVFGLLGILSRRVRSPELAKLLKIDYRLPVQTVYFNAAKSSIHELQDLAICHCQTFTPKHIKNLPSWVPDWSTKSDRSPTIVLRPHNRIEGRIGGKISFASDAMRVNGYFVDTICYQLIGSLIHGLCNLS